MTRIGMALDPGAHRVIARRRRRNRRIAEVMVAVVATAELLGAGWILTQRSVSTAVDVDDLLAELRTPQGVGQESRPDAVAAAPSAGAPSAEAPPAPADPDAAAQRAPDGGGVTTPSAADPAPGDGADDAPGTAGAGSPAPAPGAATGFALPAEGVYAYASEGYESISLGGARHDYPDETFAIVGHDDGCRWTFDHRVVEEKRTVNTYCNEGPVQAALAYDGYVTFYGSTVESHYTCDHGTRADLRDAPGARHTGQCSDDESTTTDTVTFVGREVMDVGGVSVETLHYHIDTVVHGSIEGRSTQEVWVHPEHALLVRLERDTETSAHEFGAQVDYVEHAVFRLASLTPRS